MSFKIEIDEEFEDEHIPEYLQKDIANFKAKRAKYPKTRHDKNGQEFLKIATDRDLEIIHEITNIYRVKKGGLGTKLVWSDNQIMRDKDGNDLEPKFYHTYGTSKYPVILYETDRNGRKTPIPGGIKIKHEIDFTPEGVDKIIELCHDDFKSQINFVYCELASDSKDPVNTSHTYRIKSLDIFKNATDKDIKRMIAAKKTDIDSLSELNSPIPVVQTIPVKSKG